MKFLRFKDLKQRNVVRNWTTLTRLMREQGFRPALVSARRRGPGMRPRSRRRSNPSHRLPCPAAKKQPHRNGRDCAEAARPKIIKADRHRLYIPASLSAQPGLPTQGRPHDDDEIQNPTCRHLAADILTLRARLDTNRKAPSGQSAKSAATARTSSGPASGQASALGGTGREKPRLRTRLRGRGHDQANPPPAPGRRDLRPAVLEPAVHGHRRFLCRRHARRSLHRRRQDRDRTSSRIARDAAVLLSLALQHGVPPETIRHAVTRGASEEPASILGAVVDSITTKSFSGGV